MDQFTRLAPTEQEPEAQTDSTFRFVFSNQTVGRDGHVVLNKGIQTANYLRNPVILFAHDDKSPPIGRGSNIDTAGINCRIDVTFVPADVLPFAGTIRDLVAGKWLRALSMSGQPLDWKYSTDRDRPGGVDFTKVDLLEVSVVPLPALPDALADARSHGVNVRPLRQWAERVLDTPTYRALPRSRLEAIYRAARPRSQMREDHRERAQAIRRRIRREDAAAERGYETDEDRAAIARAWKAKILREDTP